MEEKNCTDIIRQERAAYAREWRKKNPQKDLEIRNRYWLNRAKKRLIEEERNGGEYEHK